MVQVSHVRMTRYLGIRTLGKEGGKASIRRVRIEVGKGRGKRTSSWIGPRASRRQCPAPSFLLFAARTTQDTAVAAATTERKIGEDDRWTAVDYQNLVPDGGGQGKSKSMG